MSFLSRPTSPLVPSSGTLTPVSSSAPAHQGVAPASTSGEDFTGPVTEWWSYLSQEDADTVAAALPAAPTCAASPQSATDDPWFLVPTSADGFDLLRLFRRDDGQWRVRTHATGAPRIEAVSFPSVPFTLAPTSPSLVTPNVAPAIPDWIPSFTPSAVVTDLVGQALPVTDHGMRAVRVQNPSDRSASEALALWVATGDGTVKEAVFYLLERSGSTPAMAAGVPAHRLADYALATQKWTGQRFVWRNRHIRVPVSGRPDARAVGGTSRGDARLSPGR